eukprot:1460901-Rhodomonas_salina.4
MKDHACPIHSVRGSVCEHLISQDISEHCTARAQAEKTFDRVAAHSDLWERDQCGMIYFVSLGIPEDARSVVQQGEFCLATATLEKTLLAQQRNTSFCESDNKRVGRYCPAGSFFQNVLDYIRLHGSYCEPKCSALRNLVTEGEGAKLTEGQILPRPLAPCCVIIPQIQSVQRHLKAVVHRQEKGL